MFIFKWFCCVMDDKRPILLYQLHLYTHTFFFFLVNFPFTLILIIVQFCCNYLYIAFIALKNSVFCNICALCCLVSSNILICYRVNVLFCGTENWTLRQLLRNRFVEEFKYFLCISKRNLMVFMFFPFLVRLPNKWSRLLCCYTTSTYK